MSTQRERQRPEGPPGGANQTAAERERLAERRERTARLLEAGAAATAAVLSTDSQAFITANRQRGGE